MLLDDFKRQLLALNTGNEMRVTHFEVFAMLEQVAIVENLHSFQDYLTSTNPDAQPPTPVPQIDRLHLWCNQHGIKMLNDPRHSKLVFRKEANDA